MTPILTKTHRVNFKQKGVEPILIDNQKAADLIAFRRSPDYNPKQIATFDDPVYQCEIGTIGSIELLDAPLIKYGQRVCQNEMCTSRTRIHAENEVCPYELTGKCEECGKVMWERDREFSIMKFNRVVCRAHSPFARSEELAPGDDSISRMLQGAISYFLIQGFDENVAMEKAVAILEKRGVVIKPRV
jgi:hypothetical protein